jgi:hypothetical protein
VVSWHDTPDGRQLKIVLDGSEWLVLVEGDERTTAGATLASCWLKPSTPNRTGVGAEQHEGDEGQEQELG